MREKLPNSPELPQAGGYNAFVPRFYTLWRMLSNKINELADQVTTIITTGGTPADPDMSVQFNQAGAFGGDALLTWNYTNDYLKFGAPSHMVITAGDIDSGDDAFYIEGANTGGVVDVTYLKLYTPSSGSTGASGFAAFNGPVTGANLNIVQFQSDQVSSAFTSMATGSATVYPFTWGFDALEYINIMYPSGNLRLMAAPVNVPPALPSDRGYKLDVQGVGNFDSHVIIRDSASSNGFVLMDRNSTPGRQFVMEGKDSSSSYGSVVNIWHDGATNASPKGAAFALWNADQDTSANGTQFQVAHNTTYGPVIFTQAVGTGSAKEIAFKAAWDQASTPAQLVLDTNGNVTVGSAAIATNATNGFLYVPTCAGTPTGTPTTKTGRAPIVIDTTNHKLYFYSGGAWRDAGP
jgi:hypothetical protein